MNNNSAPRGATIEGKKVVLYGPNASGKSMIIKQMMFERLPHAKVVHVDERCATFPCGSSVCTDNIAALSSIIAPEVVQRLYLVPRGDVFCDPITDSCIPPAHLSYGQRRRLLIEAALETGDFVAIENFEAGLHVDYIADLMFSIAKSKAEVVLETHSGLVVRGALRHGFSAYYVTPTGIKRIERLDDDKLFAQELSALHLIVL